MSITSNELARLCNVSRGTVDRALNGRGGISPETKERILEAAREYGYVPHLLASSLATGKSHTVGVIVFDLRSRFFAQLVGAVEQQMSAMGFFTYVCMSEKDKDAERQILLDLISRRVDGILLLPVNDGDAFKELVRAQSTPIVTVSNRLDPLFHFVGGDDRAAVYRGMERFYQKGYRQVHFVCPPLRRQALENISAQAERAQGYLDFLRDHPEVSGGVLMQPDYLDAVQALVEQAREPLGFFCSSDHYALKLLAMAHQKKYRIPGSFGLMGFDGVDILDYLETRMSTINYPAKEIGTAAARMLHDLIARRGAPMEHLIPCVPLPGDTL